MQTSFSVLYPARTASTAAAARWHWLLVACSLLLPATARAAEKPAAQSAEVKLPDREQFHLYLLIGQSNMAGRGKVTDQQAPARVLKLTKAGTWAPATDPLHFDKPSIAGVGPGSGFGPAMAEADGNITIGLIPCAVGGTPLKRWEQGGDLYRQAVRRARIAMKHGRLKGILWHQGESDSKSEKTAASYAKRLDGMVVALRKDLEAEVVPPFVCGELGPFLTAAGRYPHWQTINVALQTIDERVPLAACASAKGLKAKADGVHFDAASARALGQRMAAEMLKLHRQPVPAAP